MTQTASKAVNYIHFLHTTQLSHSRQRPSNPHLEYSQLLQWYSQCRDIRRNPLPYSVVKDDAIVDLLAHRETPAIQSDVTQQLFITPALTDDGTSSTNPFNPAVIQHAILFITTNPLPTRTPPRPRLPILPPTSIRRDSRPPPRLFSTNYLMSAPFPKLYSQSWTKKIPHTGNASRKIPNTMCGLVGTFLISAKMFLIPCVLCAISGTISNMFLIPNNIRNNLCVPDIMWNHVTMFLIWRCLFSYYDNLLLISSIVLYL